MSYHFCVEAMTYLDDISDTRQGVHHGLSAVSEQAIKMRLKFRLPNFPQVPKSSPSLYQLTRYRLTTKPGIISSNSADSEGTNFEEQTGQVASTFVTKGM